MYDLVITNATIVAADLQYKGSICIKDGKIAAIATDAPEVVDAAQTIDAQGLLAFPGLIDVHAHLGERGEGDTESVTCSSKAAAVGGITTCVDMPTNQPVIKNAEILREKIRYMKDECRIDHILYGALIRDNQADLKEMAALGATCFKAFLSYSGEEYTSPNMYEARKAMQEIAKFDGIASFHCEDFSITSGLDREMCEGKIDDRRAFLNTRPVSAEIIATQNIITLAEETGCRTHILHVSHPDVAELIRRRRRKGASASPARPARTICASARMIFCMSAASTSACRRCARRRRAKRCGAMWKRACSPASALTTRRARRSSAMTDCTPCMSWATASAAYRPCCRPCTTWW